MIVLRLTRQQVSDCSHVGDCYEDTQYWAARMPRLHKIPIEDVRAVLLSSGGWQAEDLTNDDYCRCCLLWIAACDCKEEGTCTAYLDAC